ncbi:hypothetical protein [Arthrobacter sp. Alg241-R88]|uniref:hypothetical protein n=1 Tax=Arthrobacter sp. Alg241-R88 TaxID=2305984 RepID=UPI0013CF741B|nr:hypothetical protein [Arthrobacter sp. Alg241-R88]
MNNQKQGRPWYKKSWVYTVILPIFIGVGIAIFGVLFEYVVVKPVENEPPTAIFARIGSLLWRTVPWIVGAVVLLLLIKSIVQKRGRARWAALWDFVTGLRFRAPVTVRKHRWAKARLAAEQQRDAKRLKFDAGYAKRSAEVAAERAAVRKPDWEIRPQEHRGQVNYALYNYAYPVSKVRLTAPSEYFDFGGYDPRFPDPFEGRIGGGFSGKYFEGQPTDNGMSEGVDFTIHYVDENGDPQEDLVTVKPALLKRAAADDEKVG